MNKSPIISNPSKLTQGHPELASREAGKNDSGSVGEITWN
jgi:hypothetical protein